MVKIRLMRLGAKKNPHYRIVVVDARKRRNSAYIESLGYYDPRETVAEPLKVNAERAQYWLSQGAQPTDTALKLLERAGVDAGNVDVKRGKAYAARTQAAQAQA
ncbi:30S ribosomal protein S16 [Truepera radiovictrix]|nr:30S ribosomal protein S16 [Truepera radiovictrix]WMT58833.1 30S ribosomal protein S16 [Truepera radiovictrix]